MGALPDSPIAMSNKQNDIYVERALDEFTSADTGTKRGRIIDTLRKHGLDNEADYLQQKWETERKEFLDSNSFTEDDVLTDELGNEYCIYYAENGNPTEPDYGFLKQVVRIPDYLVTDKH